MEHDTYLFAALRFTEDVNICDRVYWYLADFLVQAGERVLAPVGPHDRLQCARVERVAVCSSADAPYDVALCKHIEAPFGARKLEIAGTVCIELGGVRYDDRHFTRYCKILFAQTPPTELAALRAYGVERLIEAGEDALSELARAKECVLLYGEGARELAQLILSIVRGEDEEVPPSVAFAIREKLR